MQPDLSEHFHFEEHNGLSYDCSITLIDKTDGSETLQDRKRVGVQCLKQSSLIG